MFSGAERSHWLRYDENMSTRHAWATQLLNAFRDDVKRVRSCLATASQANSPTYEQSPSPLRSDAASRSANSAKLKKSQSATDAQSMKASMDALRSTRLLENGIVVRLEDLVVYQVPPLAIDAAKLSC